MRTGGLGGGAGGDAPQSPDGAWGLLFFIVPSEQDLMRNQSSRSCGVSVIVTHKKPFLFSTKAQLCISSQQRRLRQGRYFRAFSPRTSGDPRGVAALSPPLHDTLLHDSPSVGQAAAWGSLVCASAHVFAQQGDSVAAVLNVLLHSPSASPSTKDEPATCSFWLPQSNDRHQLFLFFKLLFLLRPCLNPRPPSLYFSGDESTGPPFLLGACTPPGGGLCCRRRALCRSERSGVCCPCRTELLWRGCCSSWGISSRQAMRRCLGVGFCPLRKLRRGRSQPGLSLLSLHFVFTSFCPSFFHPKH